MIDGAGISEAARALLAERARQVRAGGSLRRRGLDTALLSTTQLAGWLFGEVHAHRGAGTLPKRLRLRGRLDCGALGRALSEIVARHESLRTVFTSENGELAQRVSPPRAVPVPEVDLRTHDPATRAATADRLLQADAHRPFNLGRDLLLRALLVRLTDEEYALQVTFHHIGFDGWSTGVFLRELGSLYSAFSAGAPSPLEPAPLQYIDYAVWERSREDTPEFEADRRFWRDRLAGASRAVDLPTDRPHPALRRLEVGTAYGVIPAPLCARLAAIAQDEGATLFALTFAAFQVLVSRRSNQDDLILGALSANRAHRATEAMIGSFMAVLPIRARLADAPAFRVHLGRTREFVMEAFAHQSYPFQRLLGDLAPGAEPGQHSLTQVVFNYRSMPIALPAMRGLTVSEFQSPHLHAAFDLHLNVTPEDQELRLALEYAPDLFDPDTADRWVAGYLALLEAIAADPDRSIAELPIMPDEERRRIVDQWSRAPAGEPAVRRAPATIPDWFEAQVARSPNAVAVSCGHAQLTYAELNREANRVAHQLLGLGVTPGSVVGLRFEPSVVELIIGVLGILKAGGAYLPIDLAAPTERAAYMLRDANATLLLTQRSLFDPGLPASPVCIEDLAGSDGEHNPERSTGEADLAYVMFTSGSTGKPKGVLITHGSVTHLFKASAGWCEFRADDVWTQSHSIAFDFSVWEIWGALLHGARLVLVPRETAQSAEAFHELVAHEGVTTLSQTPTAFAALIEADRRSDSRLALRLVALGGEALPLPILAPWFAKYGDSTPRVANIYGPTECTVWATFRRITAGDLDRGCLIGRPLSGTRVFILDPLGAPVPQGVAGEIYIGGAGLGRGYLNRPELDAGRFLNREIPGAGSQALYRTGDVARFMADGEIEYLGRGDSQVKIRGFRIELGEIDAALVSHPDVSAAATVVNEDPSGDRRLVAYLVSREGCPSPEALRTFLLRSLPQYMVPTTFVSVERIPQNQNGKVDRRALARVPVEARSAAGRAPVSPTENAVARIWEEVLGVPSVGRDDRFFDLGGHSLLAMRVASRLRTRFQVDVSIRTMLEHSALVPLAAEVDRLVALGDAPATPRIGRSNERVRGSPRRIPRRVDRSPAPATAEQRLLWEVEQACPGVGAYHLPLLVRLDGELDLPALASSFEDLVRIHEVLRTSFGERDGVLEQRIEPSVPLPLEIIDLRSLAPEEREPAARAALLNSARKPLELDAAPLCRASLARITDHQALLLFSVHHIVCDGWSFDLLLRHLDEAYTARSQGHEPSLRDPEVDFGDYAAWQASPEGSTHRTGHRAYWRQVLQGADLGVTLPADHRRVDSPTFAGHAEWLRLPAEVLQALEETASRHDTTLNVVLLAAFRILLYRLSRQDDLTLGIVLAGRDHLDVERIAGYFARTVLIRTVVTPETSLTDLLLQTRTAVIGALDHPASLDEVVDAVDGTRDWAFRLIFSYNDHRSGRAHLGKASMRRLATAPLGAKADLSVAMTRSHEGLEAVLQTRADLFHPETTRQFLHLYATLLAELATGRTELIASIRLTSPEERARLLALGTGAKLASPPARSVAARFLEQSRATPEATAVIWEGVTWSFGLLADRAAALAGSLRQQGIGSGDVVAVLARRSPETVMAMVAVVLAGAAYLAIDPAQPESRIRGMLTDSETRLALGDAPGEAAAGRLVPVLRIDAWEKSAAPGFEPVTPDPEDPVYLIYTSGSTGQPKGVLVPHRALSNHMAWMLEEFPLVADDVVLQRTALGFDASVWEVWAPLMAGRPMVLAGPDRLSDPGHLGALMQEHGVTVLQVVPSMLGLLLESGALGACDSLRRVFAGGEALPVELARRFHQAVGADLVNLYGPTEATIDATWWRSEPAFSGDSSPIGRPIANVRAYVLDEQREPAAIGVPGELYLGGAGVALGYLNRPELTAMQFVPDPFQPSGVMYRTGDRARWRRDGMLEYLGRLDDQLKVHGIRVEPGEIEALLNQLPEVSESAVSLAPDGRGGSRLVAHVVPAPGAAPTTASVRSALAAVLPGALIPVAIGLLDQLPRTASGKLNRRGLPAPALDGGPRTPPQTPGERQVAEVWCEVLQREMVSREDNLFAVGGHSLIAIRIANRLRSVTGIDVSLATILQYPTVELLAAQLVQLRTPDVAGGAARRVTRAPRA